MDTSPTGTPVIPPKYVPLLVLALTALSSALVVIQQNAANPTVKLACAIILGALGPALAALSPGLRKNDGPGTELGTKLGQTGAVKTLLALVVLGAVVTAAPARAQVLVSSGPTLPLIEVRPGNLHPVNLAPGAGYQLSLTTPAFQRAFNGHAWDLLDVNLMAFGSAVSTKSASFGALSLAVGICTLSSLLCAGVGHDVATSPGVAPGWFGIFALSLNVALSPSASPAGTSAGAGGLVRGNTLFLSGG